MRQHFLKENMLKKLLSIFLSAALLVMPLGCYKRSQLPNFETTADEVKREVEVHTKQGQAYRLIVYKITETKIIGKDKEGERHEDLLANIESITVISKHSAGETFLVVAVIGGLIYLVYLGLGSVGIEGASR
jgi:hypothetical protein